MVNLAVIINITNKLKISGIYKITYDNNKIYIGQAINIWSRAHEHNNKSRYPCDKALKKHKAKIEILEQVTDITQLDLIESKWIKFYNATDKKVGYNILEDGNASNKSGVNNCNAIFNQQELAEIYELLINHKEKSLIEIANQYGVHQMTILKISKGYTYFNPELTYPLRENNHDSQKKDWSDYFTSEEDLFLLKDDLSFRWDLSIENDLTKKYNIPLRVLRDINQGRKFKEFGSYEYPLRKKNVRNNIHFSYQNILDILYDLRYSNMSQTEIANKYNINRNTVSNINCGKTYVIKDYDYPARS